ncbi:hypothetical protein ACRWQN_02730 [Shewanella sp. HL-SH8]|jgi:hypothetical protein|uniref:hypothetical protein n=1 Tax=Shewanella TaxID=22 RepID=UPI001CF91810|nr:hypothetical protein [Shewanella glacialimarina]UCX06290.1 hypothetical protein FJ709_18370 [Shewanella glacialimarina]
MSDLLLTQLKAIDRKMLMIAIIDFPGSLLFGLGLYGIFAGFDKNFLPMLADQQIIYAMILVGGGIMLWGGWKMLILAREKQHILAQHK